MIMHCIFEGPRIDNKNYKSHGWFNWLAGKLETDKYKAKSEKKL